MRLEIVDSVWNGRRTYSFNYSLTDEEKEWVRDENVAFNYYANYDDLIEFLKLKGIDMDAIKNALDESQLTRAINGHHQRENDYMFLASSPECGILEYMERLGPAPAIETMLDNADEFCTFVVNRKLEWLKERIADGYKRRYGAETILVKPDIVVEGEDDFDLNIITPSFIVTDNGVFKINIAKTNMDSIEDIGKAAVSSIRNSLNMQFSARESVYRDEIAKLEADIEKIRQSSFTTALNLMEELSNDWTLDNGHLIYKHNIYPRFVKYQNKVYRLLNDDKKFFATLKIPIYERVSEAYHNKKSNHPNISDEGNVCLGDLDGHPLKEVVQKLPDELLTINLDSAYWKEPILADPFGERMNDTRRGKIQDAIEEHGEYTENGVTITSMDEYKSTLNKKYVDIESGGDLWFS